MNYKKFLPILSFPLLWVALLIGSDSVFGFFGKGDLDVFLYLNSYYTGYHYMLVVETVHTTMYLCFLVGIMPKLSNIHLIRTGKDKFVYRCFRTNFLAAGIFSFAYVATSVIGNLLVVDFSILQENRFVMGNLLDFAGIFVYYLMVGSIYFVIWVVMKFSVASQWLCSVFFVSLVLLYITFGWNIQLLYTDILDDIYEKHVIKIEYFLFLVKNVIICFLSSVLTLQLFKKEDILCKYEI